MTIHARRRIFYAFLAVFLILGTAVLLYVSGWRFDPATFTFSKVGGIYVRSYPRDAKIVLDKKPIDNNSGFFQSGTLIGDLFPKTYTLQLSMEGYKPWLEKVPVAPSLVSDEKNAVLIPEKTDLVASGTVSQFFMLNGTPVLRDAKGVLSVNKIRVGSGGVSGSTKDFSKVLSFDPASNAYSWFDAGTGTRTSLNPLLVAAGIGSSQQFKVVLDPYDTQNAIVLQPSSIALLNVGTRKLSSAYRSVGNTIVNIAPSQFLFAWTEWNAKSNTSTLVIYDKFLQRILPTNTNFKGKNAKIEWETNNQIALLQNDGSFSIYDRNSGTAKKIADDVKDFSFTNNASAVAALEQNSLEIFFFSQDNNYYRFNLPDIRSVKSIEWYGDQSHLFVHYPSEIKLLDLKDAALANFTPVVETSFGSYDAATNALYFVANDGLERLEFPR